MIATDEIMKVFFYHIMQNHHRTATLVIVIVIVWHNLLHNMLQRTLVLGLSFPFVHRCRDHRICIVNNARSKSSLLSSQYVKST